MAIALGNNPSLSLRSAARDLALGFTREVRDTQVLP